MRTIQSALLIIVAHCILGCAARPREHEDRLRVAVSVPPHAWLVEQVGGEHVNVLTLVQPGQSAEMYQPDQMLVSQVSRAAVFFRTGVPVETRGLRALFSSQELKVVDLRDGIELREMAEHGHAGEHEHEAENKEHASQEGKDPHIWLSPPLLKIQARTAANGLAEADPANRDEYLANLATLEKKLDEMDREIRGILNPHRGRAFVVFHPAWGYFADEYGLREIAIETEGKTPSDRELTVLQEQVRAENIGVVFVPRASSRRAADAMARAVDARVEVLDDLAANVHENLLSAARTLAESFSEKRP